MDALLAGQSRTSQKAPEIGRTSAFRQKKGAWKIIGLFLCLGPEPGQETVEIMK